MTLQEYLVSLGFKVDNLSWQKFNSAVGRSAKDVGELGTATVATASAAVAMVERIARAYEELYYVSQRTGASVQNLQAYGYAARQAGLSSDAMRGAIEGLAAAERTQPGVKQLFRRMGADSEDAAERVFQIVDGLKRRFGEAGYYAAKSMAALAGLDEPTFRMLWLNGEKMKAQAADLSRRQKEVGFDAKKASEEFTNFMQSIRRLGSEFGLLEDRLAYQTSPKMRSVIDWATTALHDFNKLDNQMGGFLSGSGALLGSVLGIWVAKMAIVNPALRLMGIEAGAAATAVSTLLRVVGPVALLFGIGKIADETFAKDLPKTEITGDIKSDTKNMAASFRVWFRNLMGWEQEQDDIKRLALPRASKPAGTEGKPGWTEKAGDLGKVQGMNIDMVDKLRRMRADMPDDLGGFKVGSGFRTPEEQADLYRRKPHLAAPPGHSKHERGEAADIEFGSREAREWMHAHAAEYGLRFPMLGGGPGRKYEPWHIERAPERTAETEQRPPDRAPPPKDAPVSRALKDMERRRVESAEAPVVPSVPPDARPKAEVIPQAIARPPEDPAGPAKNEVIPRALDDIKRKRGLEPIPEEPAPPKAEVVPRALDNMKNKKRGPDPGDGATEEDEPRKHKWQPRPQPGLDTPEERPPTKTDAFSRVLDDMKKRKTEPWQIDVTHADRMAAPSIAPWRIEGALGAEGATTTTVTLNQHTEIKVAEGPTAMATAQSVMAEQQRVNGDAVRNMGAKIR